MKNTMFMFVVQFFDLAVSPIATRDGCPPAAFQLLA